MIRAALVGVVAAACACSSAKQQAADDKPVVTVTSDAAAVIAIDAAAVVATGPIPAESRLLLTSRSRTWEAKVTELALWERADAAAPWRPVRAWKGSLGYGGLGWGDGLHGAGAPAGHDGPVKREGDGKSPAGVFALGDTYGYGAAPPAKAATPYTQVDDRWHCVDDSSSKHYNRIVDDRVVAKDWSSAEEMRRQDVQYTWVVDVAHNRAAKPEGGSCIFLHVWRGPGSATTGCTAMEQPDIEALLADLDPARRPVLVQLPAEHYDRLTAAWQLPVR